MATDVGPGGEPERGADRAPAAPRRTPEQERRAAERARRIRERRAADRAASGGSGAVGTAAARRGRAGAGARAGGRRSDPHYRRRRAVAVLATAVVVLLGASAAGWWALREFGPAVRTVEVSGTRQIPQRDVVDAAGVEPGTPLAAVDTDAVGARVSAIPGIASVEVSRSWPDALGVAVTERTPAGTVDGPDGRMLVDVGGYPYRTAPPDVRLPLLTLPTVAPDDPATLAATAVLTALPAPVRDQVSSIGLGPGGTTFELVLTGDRRVLWGPWMDAAAVPRRAAVLGPLLTREGSVYDVASPELATVR